MTPAIATVAILACLQEKPDQSGLSTLKEAMAILQDGDTSILTGRREFDGEFDGDYVIYREKHSRLRYDYCGYFGDNLGFILTPKAMAVIDGDGNQSLATLPKSWGARSENPNTDSYGGVAVSLLAPVGDIGTFVDLKKDVIPVKDNPGAVEFTHVSGTKVTVALRKDKSVVISVPQPGFGGFRPPTTAVDTIRVRAKGVRLPDWLFAVNATPQG